jgi:hypothetical protein
VTALPGVTETLLLRAALGDGDRAIADWQAWRGRVDFDDVRGDAVGLVPLLYRNLRRLGVEPAAVARYASVYRHTWAANRLAFQATAEVLATLGAAGIDTLVLKGAALALGYYRDAGARPMNDVDVLVPSARIGDAIAVLHAAGFTTTAPAHALARDHSIPFVDRRRRNIDLHWHVAGDACHARADDEMWRAARPLTVEGVATRCLGPTELLYHIVVHAHDSNTAHLRWAADAMKVLAADGIDWDRLVGLARARHTVLPVRLALGYLAGSLDAAVPDAVLRALAQAPIGWLDRTEHRHQLEGNKYTFAKVLLRHWCRHRRSTAATGAALAAGFPAYLARYYGVESVWRLPRLGVVRGLRRIRDRGLV